MAKHRKVPRAGFIPYSKREDGVYIMIMVPSDPKYGGDRPQIAKGKVEEGESAEEAGIREAEEEIGLVRTNIVKVEHLGTFLGYTDIFYGEVKDEDNFVGTTYETAEAYWISVSEFLEKGRDIHKPIIKAFKRAIGV